VAVSVADQVEVESRTWPGINKPGGHGRVVKVNDDGTVNVKYVLGGSEKCIDAQYVVSNEDPPAANSASSASRRRSKSPASRKPAGPPIDTKAPAAPAAPDTAIAAQASTPPGVANNHEAPEMWGGDPMPDNPGFLGPLLWPNDIHVSTPHPQSLPWLAYGRRALFFWVLCTAASVAHLAVSSLALEGAVPFSTEVLLGHCSIPIVAALLVWRLVVYTRLGFSWYLLDMCYVWDVMLVLNLSLGYWPALRRMLVLMTTGPVPIAAALLRMPVLLHHPESMSSWCLHLGIGWLAYGCLWGAPPGAYSVTAAAGIGAVDAAGAAAAGFWPAVWADALLTFRGVYLPWAALHLLFVLAKQLIPDSCGGQWPTLFEDMLGPNPDLSGKLKFCTAHAVFTLATVFVGALVASWHTLHLGYLCVITLDLGRLGAKWYIGAVESAGKLKLAQKGSEENEKEKEGKDK
jgi:hypothetical protein